MALDSRRHKDINRIIPAGAEQFVGASGEFIFVKGLSAPTIDLIVAGETVEMQKGDLTEGQRFDGFYLRNESAVPVTVVLVVGWGRYNRVIVQGQISAVPGILNANGEVIDDTRRELALYVQARPGTGYTENANDAVKQIADISGMTAAWYAGTSVERPKAFSFNPDYSSLIHGYAYKDEGINKPSIFTIDPYSGAWGLVSRVPDFGEDTCAAFDGVHYYVGGTFGAGLRRAAAGDDLEQSANWTQIYSPDINDVEILSDGRIVVAEAGYGVRILDASGGVLLSRATSRSNGVALVNGEIWARYDGGNFSFERLDPDDLSLIGNTSFVDYLSAFCGFGYYYVSLRASGSPSEIYARAIEATTVEIEGLAVEACTAAQLIAPPSKFEAARLVDASVTVDRTNAGAVIVTGEVIRMALEWYRRRGIAADYLDHVHAVEILNAAPVSPTSHNRRVVRSNGKTFDAANIADSFTARLPAIVTVTVDNGLNLE